MNSSSLILGMSSMPVLGATDTPSLPATGAPSAMALGAPSVPALGASSASAFGTPSALAHDILGGDSGFFLYLVLPTVTHPYATIFVKSHIPLTLSMTKNASYSKWVSLFKSMCGKFGLRSHIYGTVAPRPDDPDWDQADYCIRFWIFGSTNDSVLDLAIDGDAQTARNLRLAIEHLFCANK
jgi:hypothetical protein